MRDKTICNNSLKAASLIFLAALLLACDSTGNMSVDNEGDNTENTPANDTDNNNGGTNSGGNNNETNDNNGSSQVNNNTGGSAAVSFRSIQSSVFTPSCSVCHNGFLNSGNLNLTTADLSYANLVGIGSSGKNGATLVITGMPDDSYLIQKLEGSTGIVGTRMPQAADPLPAETIQQIRNWISQGALDN